MGTGTKTPALSTQPRVISLDRLLRALPTYCCLSNACLFCDKVPPLLVILVRSASAQERAEELEGQGPRPKGAFCRPTAPCAAVIQPAMSPGSAHLSP